MKIFLRALRARFHSSAKKGVRKAERGMTLVEIMVVVIIISLVAGIVGVQVFNSLGTAKNKVAATQIKQISEALELYKLSFHAYPSTGEGLQALISPKGNAKPFMPQVPKDPWDRDYVYIFPGTGNRNGFDIISYGEDGVQGGGDDITNYSTGESAQN